MRRLYTYAGLSVVSDIELIGLPAGLPLEAPDLSVTCAALPGTSMTWVTDPTNSWWSEVDDERGWWLQVSGQAVVCVADEGRRVLVDIIAGADPEFVSHLVIDFVLPVCLDLLGRLVVHATAVELNGSVIVFAAPTGSGKSTLAIAMARRGGAMVADDALVVEHRDGQSWVQPTVATTRLHRDMAEALFGNLPIGPAATFTGKHRVDLVGSGVSTAVTEARLTTLVLLTPERNGAPVLRAVESSTAVGAVLGNLFHRGATDTHAVSLMDRVISLVTSVAVFEFGYERDLARLDELAEMVEASL